MSCTSTIDSRASGRTIGSRNWRDFDPLPRSSASLASRVEVRAAVEPERDPGIGIVGVVILEPVFHQVFPISSS